MQLLQRAYLTRSQCQDMCFRVQIGENEISLSALRAFLLVRSSAQAGRRVEVTLLSDESLPMLR